MKLLHVFSFPLFSKDLAERAARPRTYLARGLFGILLVAWFAVGMHQLNDAPTGGSVGLLGIGNKLLERLATFMCWSILLIQPAIMASALTHEKERGSLELLLLTDTSPTKLLLEKFLAGLVPMATFLLFAMPLAAICYAYGGVTWELANVLGLVLLAAWLQAGAFALMCSAWCRTTAGAIIASYTLLGLFYIGTEVMLNSEFLRKTPAKTWNAKGTFGENYTNYQSLVGALQFKNTPSSPSLTEFPIRCIQTAFAVNSAGGFSELFSKQKIYQRTSLAASPEVEDYASAVLRSTTWIAFSALCFLLLARLFLLRRATPRAARRLGRGLALISDSLRTVRRRPSKSELIDDYPLLTRAPVLWLESLHSAFGTRRYLFRAGLLFIQFAVPLTLGVGAYLGKESGLRMITFIIEGSLFISIGIVLVRSAGLFATERTNQTLEILLTTPIPSIDIVHQKARSVRRLCNVLIAAIGVFALMRWTLRKLLWITQLDGLDGMHFGSESILTYTFIAVASTTVIFWQARWMGVWMGLVFSTRTRALLATLGLYALLIMLPPYLGDLWQKEEQLIRLASPLELLWLNERGNVLMLQMPLHAGVTQIGTMKWVLKILAFHSLIALFFRSLSLWKADRYLRRVT